MSACLSWLVGDYSRNQPTHDIIWCYGFHHKMSSFYIYAWLWSSNFSDIHVRMHTDTKYVFIAVYCDFIRFPCWLQKYTFSANVFTDITLRFHCTLSPQKYKSRNLPKPAKVCDAYQKCGFNSSKDCIVMCDKPVTTTSNQLRQLAVSS